MPARSPKEICRLFQQFMAAGDLESLLASTMRRPSFWAGRASCSAAARDFVSNLRPWPRRRSTFYIGSTRSSRQTTLH